jgi:hypothetical protein
VQFAERPSLSFHAGMAPKYHPTPVSGSHRKALDKELTRARAMTSILARRAAETRAAGEAMIREADDLLCQSWNERMWADGGPVDPCRMAGSTSRKSTPHSYSAIRGPRPNTAPD